MRRVIRAFREEPVMLQYLVASAIYRDGLGATLLCGDPTGTRGPTAPAPAASSPALARSGRDWPVSLLPEVQHLVDETFIESNPRRLRRTQAVLTLALLAISSLRAQTVALPAEIVTASILHHSTGTPTACAASSMPASPSAAS